MPDPFDPSSGSSEPDDCGSGAEEPRRGRKGTNANNKGRQNNARVAALEAREWGGTLGVVLLRTALQSEGKLVRRFLQ